MADPNRTWHIKCNREVGERCLKDEKFPYIVALARAVNALMFVFSTSEHIPQHNAPTAMRDRLNSSFFGAGVMYEALNLVQHMNRPFKNDTPFQSGLRRILKDPVAQRIYQKHMNPVRNGAVFHFRHDRFADAIQESGLVEFSFVSGQGTDARKVNYSYADGMAAEILTGLPSQTEEFFGIFADTISETASLATRFADEATKLIMHHLSDSDMEEFPADQCYLEGSRSNVEAVGRALLAEGYDTFSRALLDETFNVMGAEHQVQRLNTLGTWLEKKSPIACAVGLSIRIHKAPHECHKGADAGFSHAFPAPNCVLRPGGSITVPWPVDKQIDLHGPYDAESFPDKRVKIAVVCPEEFVGEAGQFLRQLKDGINSSDENAPFRKGFVRKYHLNACDFTFHEVKRATSSLEDAYKAASLEAIKEKPNLVVTVIREQHRDLADASNPYYTSKARIMAQGIPVQLLKIETIRRQKLDYILNNISLAMYAKLGGIPWTLSPNTDLAHEIVVGIGSARLTDSRRGAGERVIGITTVFSGDGQYLLANNTREVAAEHYLEALTDSLKETVAELRSRFGWKPRDRVRFIFHQSFKKYKDVEAEAVKTFAASLKTAEGRHFGGPSLISERITAASTDDVRNIITNGKGRMPKFVNKLTSQEIDALVKQIKVLNKK